MWNHDLDIQLCNFTRWHISALIKQKHNGNSQMFTRYYGHPETSKMERSWNLLKHLKSEITMPWICMGVFNEINCQSEKVGATSRSYKQMEVFREALEFCSLSDLLTKGQKSTWSNNRQGREFTKERLDRDVVNSEWQHMFPNSTFFVLPM